MFILHREIIIRLNCRKRHWDLVWRRVC